MRTLTRDPRTQFGRTVTELLDEDLSTALVLAEISARFFTDALRRHPDRAINVGIREQLLVNVGAGLALTGLRPVVHTFCTFLVERAFEQVKLGFGHQGVGGVLVGSGGSFDVSYGGRTHQAPGDVALMDTIPGMHDQAIVHILWLGFKRASGGRLRTARGSAFTTARSACRETTGCIGSGSALTPSTTSCSANHAIDSDARKRCALPGARHRGR